MLKKLINAVQQDCVSQDIVQQHSSKRYELQLFLLVNCQPPDLMPSDCHIFLCILNSGLCKCLKQIVHFKLCLDY